MALFALIIGIVLIVSAVRNSQGALFTALGQDVPQFIVWAAAIIAIGAVGFIPGLSNVSRLLLALVIIVLIVNNYQKLVAGFTAAWQAPTPSASAPQGTSAGTNAAPTGTATASTAGGNSAANGGLLSWSQEAEQLAEQGTAVAQ